MFGLANLQDRLSQRVHEALVGEAVVMEGSVNFFRGWEAVRGWLALSPQWLVFVSHRLNWHQGRSLLPVSRIRGARCCWARFLGVPLVPNAIAVNMVEGREYKFVAYGRHQWVSVITSLSRRRL
jgi:hypothetical protein